MPIDASIYGQFAPPVRSPEDVQNGLARGAAAGLALQNQRMQVEQAQNVMQQRNGLAQAMQGGQFDLTNPAHQAQMVAQFPDVAPTLLKTVNEGTQSAAKAKLDVAQAGHADTQATDAALRSYRSMLSPGMTPDQFTQWAGALYKDPRTSSVVTAALGPPEGVQAKIAANAQNPQQWNDYLQANAMGMDKFIENKTAIRGQDLTAKTSTDNNTATNLAHLKAVGIEQAGANSRNTATIGAENTRAAATREIEAVKADPYGMLGLNKKAPPGAATTSGLSGDAFLQTLPSAVAAQVKAIAEGRLQISPMMMRSGQGPALIAAAMQYDPGTDQTTYSERNKTVQDFSSGGRSGQQLTNANLALHHAGQVADAIEKLNNSNVLPGIVNPISNLAAQKLGGDTSQGIYKQKVDALSSELRKLYAGSSGGGLHELENWQSTFDPNASKTQQQAYLRSGMELLTGAIQSKKEAFDRGMGGRGDFSQMLSPESKKVLQRLAPDYAATLSGGAAPTGGAMPTPDAIAAELKRRGH